jgi:hypothetical protein
VDARQAGDHRARRRDGAPNRRARLLVLAALIALVAAGCGSESGDGGSAGAGDGGATETTPATELTITYWPNGKDGSSQEATLTCDPAGGTHPSPQEACDLIASDPEALEPVPEDSACTLLYGGPQVATVVGTLDGEKANATFNRSGGCEIDRWDRMEAVLRVGD